MALLDHAIAAQGHMQRISVRDLIADPAEISRGATIKIFKKRDDALLGRFDLSIDALLLNGAKHLVAHRVAVIKIAFVDLQAVINMLGQKIAGMAGPSKKIKGDAFKTLFLIPGNWI